MSETNVHYAGWPRFFRVRAFRMGITGFQECGLYPITTPKVGSNQTWDWLKDQLVIVGLLTEAEAMSCGVEVNDGRTIVLSEVDRVFMLLVSA